MIDLAPDEVEDALWELGGAGLATADGFASLRVLVSRRRGEVKSHFDRITATAAAATPVRKWQDATPAYPDGTDAEARIAGTSKSPAVAATARARRCTRS
jgi:hypothetical protein